MLLLDAEHNRSIKSNCQAPLSTTHIATVTIWQICWQRNAPYRETFAQYIMILLAPMSQHFRSHFDILREDAFSNNKTRPARSQKENMHLSIVLLTILSAVVAAAPGLLNKRATFAEGDACLTVGDIFCAAAYDPQSIDYICQIAENRGTYRWAVYTGTCCQDGCTP